MRYVKLLNTTFFLAAACFVLTGCEMGDTGSESGTESEVGPPAESPEPPNPDQTVCDPFSGGGSTDITKGVVGSLYYLSDDQPGYTRVQDYLNFGHAVTDISLYFNQLHIPTRPFDRGFYNQSGRLITDQNGAELYEYFALSLKGSFQIAPSEASGLYQMAVLSDDGSILRVNDGSGTSVLVNNDGTHSTRLKCATTPISLNQDNELPFELDYFQGPRYHIALVVMWRPWPTDPTLVADPLCNRSGNSFFFNSAVNPPAPTANYNALLSRGWVALDADNYALPETAPANPCNEPAPVISGLSLTGITKTGGTVNWTTDRASTSQVSITESATGIVTLTTKDSTLVTTHLLAMTGLKSNTLYKAKAISASISGASTESTEILFRTAR